MKLTLVTCMLIGLLSGPLLGSALAQSAPPAAEAAYQKGLALDAGKDVPKDPAQAVAQFRQAATQGHVLAQLELGRRYFRGEGVSKDFAEAAKWYRQAAEAGNAKAQFNLAICLETGSGVTKDVAQAMRWYEKAAAAGDAMAQFNLAINYWRGEGVPKDKAEGLKWFLLAADQGNPKAQFIVGRMYASGSDLPKNLTLARQMLQSAADQGNEQAQAELVKFDAANSTLEDSSGLASGYKATNKADALFSGKSRKQIREQKTATDASAPPARSPQNVDRAQAPTAAPTSPPATADTLLGGQTRKLPKEQKPTSAPATMPEKPAAPPSASARASRSPAATATAPAAARPAPAPTAASAESPEFSADVQERLDEYAALERSISKASRKTGGAIPSVISTNPCNPQFWTMQGAPWGTAVKAPAAKPASASPAKPLPTFTTADYKAVVTRCMESVRTVYGEISDDETATFNQLWAPFFDNPSASIYAYFSQLLPLVDEYLRLNAGAAATAPAFEESLELAAFLSGAGDEVGARASLESSMRHILTLRQQRDSLETVVQRLQALGDPPNPMSEQCNHRSRHRQTMAALKPSGVEGEWIGAWHNLSGQYRPVQTHTAQLAREVAARAFSAEVNKSQKVPGHQFHVILTPYTNYPQPRPFSWDASKAEPAGICYYLYQFDHPLIDKLDSKTKMSMVSAAGWTPHACWLFANNMLPPVLSQPDGSQMQRFREIYGANKHYLDQLLRLRAEGDDLTVDWIGILYKDEKETKDDQALLDPAGTVVYHLQARAKRAPVRRAQNAPEGFEIFPKQAYEAQVMSLPLDTKYVSKELEAMAARQAKGEKHKDPDLPGLGSSRQTEAAAPAPLEDPQAILDSIAQRESVIGIIEQNLQRIRAEIERAREEAANGRSATARQAAQDRIKILEDQALGQEANLQGERDAVQSLQTGVYVHTRTTWDERQHQALVTKIEKEVRDLGSEARLINGLANYAALIQGADGVETRKWVQDQITEAIQSGDRLGNLRKIGGIIQTKIEARALADQAKVTEKDILSDQGLAVAQKIQEQTDGWIMLGALFVPGAGQIALGYGIGTGCAQGGLAQGFENGVRGYFDTVDVIWAGVKGYYEKDENGKIKGWENAIWEGGTTLVLNKIMEKLGGVLQGRGQAIINRGAIGPRPVVETGPARPRPPTPEVARPDPAHSQNAYQPVARAPQPGSTAPETRAPQAPANPADARPQDGANRGADTADGTPSSPYPDIPPSSHPTAKSAQNEPKFEAYKGPDERLDEDFARLKDKYGDHPAPKDPGFIKDRARLELDHGIVIERRKRSKAKDDCRKKYEAQIPKEARNKDGTVNKEHEGYKEVEQKWKQESAAISKEFDKNATKRMEELNAIIEELGMPPVKDEKSARIVLSGGEPKTIMSDIDMAARDMEAGRKLMEKLKDKGYTVKEYGDRWVVTGFDLTVWKPSTGPNPEQRVADMLIRRGDLVVETDNHWLLDNDRKIPKVKRVEKLGDSSRDAQTALDTQKGSDKFPNPGGVYDTTKGKAGIYDPHGAVLSNLKKASEAGIGGHADPDFHVIGKSVDKSVEIANKCDPNNRIGDPKFVTQAQAVRHHQTPEEAGILTFGNPDWAKDMEKNKFLKTARAHMGEAFQNSSKVSDQVRTWRKAKLAVAVARGQKEKAQKIREQMVEVYATTQASLRSIAVTDPHFVNQLAGRNIEAYTRLDLSKVKPEPGPAAAAGDPAPEVSGTGGGAYGYGWLWERLEGEPQTPPALPAPPAGPLPPALKKMSAQCQKAAAALQARLEGDMKSRGETTQQLQALKAALELATKDPIQGQFQIRALTGYELPTVLGDMDRFVLLKE